MTPSRTAPARRLLAGALALGVLLAGCGAAPPDGSPPPPDGSFTGCEALTAAPSGSVTGTSAAPAPAAELPDLTLACAGGGAPVSLRGLRGPLVINLWASWCTPCVTELPALQRLAATGSVPVLGVVTADPEPDRSAWLAHDLGLTFPSLRDDDRELQRALGETGLPLTVIVRADGKLFVHRAPVLDDASLRALVAEQLGLP
jgi:thiol-disulfide isomerase/thioredoxin